jgi:hypothetical protein
VTSIVYAAPEDLVPETRSTDATLMRHTVAVASDSL